MMMNAGFIYPENTPTSKEGYYYRTIFEKFFPKVTYLSSHLLQYQLTELDHCLFSMFKIAILWTEFCEIDSSWWSKCGMQHSKSCGVGCGMVQEP